MTLFNSDTTGAKDDTVRLHLANDEILISENYEAKCGVFEQPCAFSLRLGQAGIIRELIAKYPDGVPFVFSVGGCPQFTGLTAGFHAKASPGGTSFTSHGYDALNELHRAQVDKEKSFGEESYRSLVQAALDAVGFKGKLIISDFADRQIKAGVKLFELQPANTLADVIIDKDAVGARSDTFASQLQTKLGERWLDFVQRHIARAGMFLWCDSNGNAVLSAPNANQKPYAKITRARLDREDPLCTVLDASYNVDTTHRFSETVVYGRAGGKKFSRTKFKGAMTDEEMINPLTLPDGTIVREGYKRLMVMRDTNVQSTAQAEYLARRKHAEQARDGWNLTYIVAGHTVPAIGTGNRAVWVPNTVVTIQDEEFGISGDFYLEACTYRRGPETTTELRFMKPSHLVFGDA